MRTIATAVFTVLIAGAACGQFKANQTSPAGTTQTAQIINPSLQPGDEARRIPRDQAIKMVKEGKAIWVDVRTKDQYDLGHIKGAINVPLAELITNLAKLPPHKFLITYCA